MNPLDDLLHEIVKEVFSGFMICQSGSYTRVYLLLPSEPGYDSANHYIACVTHRDGYFDVSGGTNPIIPSDWGHTWSKDAAEPDSVEWLYARLNFIADKYRIKSHVFASVRNVYR